MVLAYWLIGREIVQELQKGEKRAAYGKAVLDRLSSLLTSHYGEGFSPTNLRSFRVFYCTYTDRASSIQHTACAELKVPSEKHHTECGEFETLPSKTEVSQIRHSLCAEFPSPFRSFVQAAPRRYATTRASSWANSARIPTSPTPRRINSCE